MARILITAEKIGDRHIHKKNVMWWQRQRWETYLEARNSKVWQQPPGAWWEGWNTLPETCGHREQCGSCQKEGMGWGKGELIYDESLDSSVFHS